LPRAPKGALFEQLKAHEAPEHGALKRFGQACRVVRGPRHEGSVPPEATVGDEQVQVLPGGAVRFLHPFTTTFIEVRLDREPLTGPGMVVRLHVPNA
jgi:hypothetical protein